MRAARFEEHGRRAVHAGFGGEVVRVDLAELEDGDADADDQEAEHDCDDTGDLGREKFRVSGRCDNQAKGAQLTWCRQPLEEHYRGDQRHECEQHIIGR